MSLKSIDSELSSLEQAAARVLSEQKALLRSQAHNNALQLQVEREEATVRQLHGHAISLIDDLGDWSAHGPRIEGLVSRIHLIHKHALEVEELLAETASDQQRVTENRAESS